MSQAPFLTLPQELIDEIVDCISDSNYDWGNKPNILRACASVCRSFRPRAQTRLFSQLRFWACDAKQLAGKVDRLDAVLHDNPHLASHVRSLCFEVQSSTIAIFHYPVLFCIVSMITQATSQLGLPSKTIIHGHGQSSDYGSHPSQFCDNRALNAQLVQPFLAPYITSMELCGLTNVPIELVTSCRSLRKLELCDVTLEASDREAIDPMLRPRLDEFTFKECGHDTIRYLVDYYLDFRYLLRLESSGDPIEDSDDLRYILDVCADSLEELSLTCIEENYLSEDVNDMGQLANLRQLEISLTFGEGYDNPLADFCAILSTLSTDNKLDTIAIMALDDPGETRYIEPDVYLGRQHWSALDAALMRVSNGNSMTLCLGIQDLDDRDRNKLDEEGKKKYDRCREILKNWPKDKLPLVSKAPHIAVDYDVSS